MTDTAYPTFPDLLANLLLLQDAEAETILNAVKHGLLVRCADAVEDVGRLRAGKFTPEELQNLCHNVSEADKVAFFAGCAEYQRKLFGESAHDRSEFEERVRKYAEWRHPGADVARMFRKACEEFGETGEAMAGYYAAAVDDDELDSEIADVALCLTIMCAVRGRSLFRAMELKIAVNEERQRNGERQPDPPMDRSANAKCPTCENKLVLNEAGNCRYCDAIGRCYLGNR